MIQKKLEETTHFIRSSTGIKPKIGVILGSGLGSFTKKIKQDKALPYSEIPHFVQTTVVGHSGQLCMGHVGDHPVAVLQGRNHFYEGRTMEEVVFPTRTLSLLGIEILILTNAAGGLNDDMDPGHFMAITDHINLMGDNPLKGPNLENLGPRFPDMTQAYDKELTENMVDLLKVKNIPHHQGVYCAVSGPVYETPAEVRYLKIIGGNAVGMSTVPESIAANHLGVRVVALSCITNKASGLSNTKLDHKEVTDTAKAVENLFCDFLYDYIANLKL